MNTLLPLIKELEEEYETIADAPNTHPTLIKLQKEANIERNPETGVYQRWTAKEIHYLKTHYPNVPASVISKKLGRSIKAIKQRASILKIKKRDLKE